VIYIKAIHVDIDKVDSIVEFLDQHAVTTCLAYYEEHVVYWIIKIGLLPFEPEK
jgi:hypothetical protein